MEKITYLPFVALLIAGWVSAVTPSAITVTDSLANTYGNTQGLVIDFDATATGLNAGITAGWVPALVDGQTCTLDSITLRSGDEVLAGTGTVYLGVYTSLAGDISGGFLGTSTNAIDFTATADGDWVTFNFSDINVTVDSVVGSGTGMLYFIFQQTTDAKTGTGGDEIRIHRINSDTTIDQALASVIAYGGLSTLRVPEYQAQITPPPVDLGKAFNPNPANGAQLGIDVTSLSWQGSTDSNIVSIDQYDLVFGTDSNMANNTTYSDVTSPVTVESLGGLNYNTRYYWRVDSHVTWDSAEITGNLQEIVEGDTWSFGVSSGLRRSISPEQPMWLVHIDTWNYADPQKIINLIPQDIRPYVVMNISLSISHDEATSQFQVAEYGYEIAKSWLRACAENRMWAMVQPSSGGYSQFSDFDLSVYEEFYRDYPNMLGFNYCEQFWGYDSYTDPLSAAWPDRIAHFANLLELSHQYGGYLVVSWCGNQWSPSINPIAMLKRIPDFAEACRNYTENYILCEKYTQQGYQSDMESLCLGAYLSGYSGQYGIRYDDTGWTDANGEHADFTMATGGAPHLEHIMLTGETVIDAPELIWTQCFRELSAGSTSNGYTMRRWDTYPQFDNVSVDLFRKILDGTVRIPSRLIHFDLECIGKHII